MTKITNKYWYLILIYSIIACVSNAGLVYGGYRLSSVINDVFNEDIKQAIKDTIIVLTSFIIAIVFYFFAEITSVYITKKLNISLKMFITAKINSLSDDEFNEYKKGDFISWFTNDVDSIGRMVFSSIFNIASGLSSVILSTYAIFYFHWIIGLSLFGVTILMIILPGIFQGLVSKKAQNMSKQKEEFSHRIENLLNGYRLFSYSNERRIFNKLIKVANIKVEKSIASYGTASSSQQSVLFALMISSQLIMMFVAIFLALNGKTDKGAMLSVANISGTFFQGVNALFGSMFTIRAGIVIFKKFKHKKIDQDIITQNIQFNKLELKDINYKIENKNIFNNLNLTIEKNKKYLVLGESGKGKTTLFKIVFGLIDNYEGEIKLNEKLSYKNLNKSNIKNIISYVPQDTIIFNDTIRNNISLFNDEVSDAEIIKAIHAVNLSDWFEKNNLDTIINSEFKNMSGGEMQKIAIARVLVFNKDVMILDEITSSLDKENRNIIENLITNLNKTILLISHTALENNNNFDKVIQL
ncbi:ATP-binding cassette domain-containing protein [Spiroplasma tabanidicola]|uniref:ABC transporter ATP-binding protein n=1 Tax=Spiroplasma tabanidicola TaxID=324079 RepID=A0A6I6C804_9MOLU|nr:ABC transporter ATP-binding protein [Spiroplasma tabanidicola]QGS51896.1 ABC transporter ATP-binding protein [Spiroplasma tabanidicola]